MPTQKQIENWIAKGGEWPPPPGINVLTEGRPPSRERVLGLLNDLLQICTPQEAEIVRQAIVNFSTEAS